LNEASGEDSRLALTVDHRESFSSPHCHFEPSLVLTTHWLLIGESCGELQDDNDFSMHLLLVCNFPIATVCWNTLTQLESLHSDSQPNISIPGSWGEKPKRRPDRDTLDRSALRQHHISLVSCRRTSYRPPCCLGVGKEIAWILLTQGRWKYVVL